MTEVTGTVARTIASFTNPQVKWLRRLSRKKHRDADGVFLGEGLKLVTDALEVGWPMKMLVYASEVAEQPAVRAAAWKCADQGGQVLLVSRQILARITRRDNPQMVMGVFEQRPGRLDDLEAASGTVWVALEGVKDPGNLGTIIRTSDACGATGVILVGNTCNPWSLETVRATMGSMFHVPVVQTALEPFLEWVRAFPGEMTGTHLAGAVDYRSVDYSEPMILLMGNEQSGLDADVANACDRLVKIPQIGRADSLNLAVSTALMLYEARRSRL